MEKSEIRKFLVRVLLDDGFRQRLADSPEEAYAEYKLTDEQKKILNRQDEAMLALIGAAVHEAQTGSPAQEPPQEAEFTTDTVEATVLTPQPAPPPPPDLPEVAFGIRIVPQTRYAPDGSLNVSYIASIHPLQPGGQPQSPPPPQRPAPPPSVWGHQLHSPAAQAAATAVKEAGEADRYSRLLELISAMKGGAR